MTVYSIGTTAEQIAEFNKNRTHLSIANDNASAKLYVDDKESVGSTDCKWIIFPKETQIFDGQGDFPERAYWAISDTASTTVIVGEQHEETR